MQCLNFEDVHTNIADTVRRAEVPGGWLVTITSDVTHMTESNGIQGSYDWRTACTFVPDPSHAWLKEVR